MTACIVGWAHTSFGRLEGETLESLIKRSGRVEVNLALEIVSQVAAGLEAVHEQKLVHRDIKPANIMVRLKDNGRVTARPLEPSPGRQNLPVLSNSLESVRTSARICTHSA